MQKILIGGTFIKTRGHDFAKKILVGGTFIKKRGYDFVKLN